MEYRAPRAQVSLDANAFLVGILARQAAKQPGAAAGAAAAQGPPPSPPPAPAPSPPARAAPAAPAVTAAPTLGTVVSAGAGAGACAAAVRVSAAWPTGNKAAPYAATVSLTVTNTAAAPAPAPLKVVLTSAAGYADAGNGQAWGWDAFSVTAGAVQGSIMQARPPAQPAAPSGSAAGCPGGPGLACPAHSGAANCPGARVPRHAGRPSDTQAMARARQLAPWRNGLKRGPPATGAGARGADRDAGQHPGQRVSQPGALRRLAKRQPVQGHRAARAPLAPAQRLIFVFTHSTSQAATLDCTPVDLRRLL